MTTPLVHPGRAPAAGEKGRPSPALSAALRHARVRRRLPGVLLLLTGAFSLFLLLRAPALPAGAAPPASAPGGGAPGAGFESRPAHGASEIVLIVPPFRARNGSTYTARALRGLLRALAAARYERAVALRVVLAPERDAAAFAARYALFTALRWPHGEVQLANASSGGLYELALSAWTPMQGDASRAVLVDASVARTVAPGWFDFVERARARYHARADVAAFAPEPTVVRAPAASPGRSNSNWAPPSLGDENPDDVFLYQGAPYAGVLAIADAAGWRAFQRWFHAHRAEWFMWPAVVRPRNRQDPEWNGFTARGRAHWTMWYARFLAEHGLYVLYPRKSAPRAPSLALAASAGILKVRYDGTVVKDTRDRDGAGATTAEVDEIVAMARRGGGSVSLTIVNEAFLETARSWICNVDVGGFRPPAVVWIATDQAAYDGLRGVQGTHAIHMRSFRGGTEATGTSFNTPGYWLLMLERTRLIRDLLDRGVGVFAFETDQIWLRNPVPAVKRLVESGDGVDLVGTLDTRNQIGGNFLYFAPTLATRRLWREVSARFAAAYFGAGMHKHTASFKRYIENDQSIMTNLVFYKQSLNPVVFRALDTDRFVDGRWYMGNKFYGDSAKSPTMINNNFLIGIEAKEERARKYGHWFWDRERRACDVKAVKNAIQRNEALAPAAARAAAAAGGAGAADAGPEEDFDVGLDRAIGGIAKSLKSGQ